MSKIARKPAPGLGFESDPIVHRDGMMLFHFVKSEAIEVVCSGLQGLRQRQFFASFCFTHLVTPANSLNLAPSLALRRFT